MPVQPRQFAEADYTRLPGPRRELTPPTGAPNQEHDPVRQGQGAEGRPPARPRGEARVDSYLIKSVVHATEILRVFEYRGEALSLRDIMRRTGYGKGMCFRLLYTLHHLGFVEKSDRRYHLVKGVPHRGDADA